MKNEIVYWGQNFIPQLSQWIKNTDDNNEKDIEMFMSKFDQLVERYPFMKSEKEESIHIWLVIYKMTEIEGWKFFEGDPQYFINEIENRINRLYPEINAKK